MQRPFKFFSGGMSLSMAPETETTPLLPSTSNAPGHVAEKRNKRTHERTKTNKDSNKQTKKKARKQASNQPNKPTPPPQKNQKNKNKQTTLRYWMNLPWTSLLEPNTKSTTSAPPSSPPPSSPIPLSWKGGGGEGGGGGRENEIYTADHSFIADTIFISPYELDLMLQHHHSIDCVISWFYYRQTKPLTGKDAVVHLIGNGTVLVHGIHSQDRGSLWINTNPRFVWYIVGLLLC